MRINVDHIEVKVFEELINMCAISSKTASESKTEMKGAVWRLPSDYNSNQVDDQSSHQALQLVCHLDNSEYGDMKWYREILNVDQAFLIAVSISCYSWLCQPSLISYRPAVPNQTRSGFSSGLPFKTPSNWKQIIEA